MFSLLVAGAKLRLIWLKKPTNRNAGKFFAQCGDFGPRFLNRAETVCVPIASASELDEELAAVAGERADFGLHGFAASGVNLGGFHVLSPLFQLTYSNFILLYQHNNDLQVILRVTETGEILRVKRVWA